MKRMEEYQELMKELEKPVSELEGTLERAKNRKRKQNMVIRPLIGLAASFALFVLLVNVSSTVTEACSHIPILRELAQAVTFSSSLSDAVENEYVQQVNQAQTVNGVTMKIEYAIVDQKNVVIFFRLTSEEYEEMCVEECKVYTADGSKLLSTNMYNGNFDIMADELEYKAMDFGDGNVPEKIKLEVYVKAPYSACTEEDIIAQFEFNLEFDPEFIATGKELSLNKTVIVDGQKLTIETVEIYPTHMRILVAEDENNTARLTSLDYYIRVGEDKVLESGMGFLKAVYTEEDLKISYRADSSYFYEAEDVKFVITGALWCEEDRANVYVNLETGETGVFPEGMEFLEATKTIEGWKLKVRNDKRADGSFHIALRSYSDMKGNEYDFSNEFEARGITEESVEEMVTLEGFEGTEIWLKLNYTDEWIADDPVILDVK